MKLDYLQPSCSMEVNQNHELIMLMKKKCPELQ